MELITHLIFRMKWGKCDIAPGGAVEHWQGWLKGLERMGNPSIVESTNAIEVMANRNISFLHPLLYFAGRQHRSQREEAEHRSGY